MPQSPSVHQIVRRHRLSRHTAGLAADARRAENRWVQLENDLYGAWIRRMRQSWVNDDARAEAATHLGVMTGRLYTESRTAVWPRDAVGPDMARQLAGIPDSLTGEHVQTGLAYLDTLDAQAAGLRTASEVTRLAKVFLLQMLDYPLGARAAALLLRAVDDRPDDERFPSPLGLAFDIAHGACQKDRKPVAQAHSVLVGVFSREERLAPGHRGTYRELLLLAQASLDAMAIGEGRAKVRTFDQVQALLRAVDRADAGKVTAPAIPGVVGPVVRKGTDALRTALLASGIPTRAMPRGR